MPRELFPPGHHFLDKVEQLDFDEVVRLVRLFVGLGVSKLRLTGGEPLLRGHLAGLVSRLAALPGVDDVALTTNGALLSRHATELRAAGLRRVTVSLDSLEPEIFRRMSGGLGKLQDVLAGIEQAHRAGLSPVKINTVVQRGVNDRGIVDLVERFRGTSTIVRFIEYMDVGNHGWDAALVVPTAELMARIAARWPLAPVAPAAPGEVATRYAFVDGQGEVGFISSVTRPFCGDCSRARLSSDGKLYTCLIANAGTDLRGPLRAGGSDEELRDLIRGVWAARADRYSELRGGPSRLSVLRPRVEMHAVGG
jgi:GTP 3',8-cyclase